MLISNVKKAQFIRHILVPLLGAAALGCSGLAFAQWKWIDANGVTQFSDRPPPPTVPENRILLRPEGSSAATVRRAVREPEPAPADNSAASQMDDEARRLEDIRRQQEAEAERLRAEQERLDAAKRAQACADARRNLETLDTGIRIRMLDDKGEFYYLNDEQRAQRRQEAQQRINEFCN